MKKRMFSLLVCGLILALSAISLTGCGETKAAAPSDEDTDETVTKTDILRDTADDGTYMLKALHAGFTEDGNTIFETIDGDKIVTGKYNPDNMYMLTMYTNNTDDKADDEVSVVWGTCLPME